MLVGYGPHEDTIVIALNDEYDFHSYFVCEFAIPEGQMNTQLYSHDSVSGRKGRQSLYHSEKKKRKKDRRKRYLPARGAARVLGEAFPDTEDPCGARW